VSNREILAHLAALVLLVLAAAGIYAWQKSPAVVPALTGYLDRDSHRVRQAAMARLRELGQAARPAVPRLLQLTADPRSRDAQPAASALARIDLGAARQVVGQARRALADEQAERGTGPAEGTTAAPARDATTDRARRAAEILGGLGLLARQAVPDLIAATASADAIVRDRALTALGRIGVPPEQIVPALVARLGDPVPHVRYAAIVALEDLPLAYARAALPQLEALAAAPASSAGAGESGRAKHALQRITAPRDTAVEISVARYTLGGRGGLDSRLYTLQRVALLGDAGAPLTAELAALVEAKEEIVQLHAIEALAAIGPGASAAVPALERKVGAAAATGSDDASAAAVLADAARWALERIRTAR
jgi:HEAT repeat protein